MPSLIGAAKKAPPAGQPKPQAPSTYPEDTPGSGSAYFGTSPAPHPVKGQKAGRTHAPRKRF